MQHPTWSTLYPQIGVIYVILVLVLFSIFLQSQKNLLVLLSSLANSGCTICSCNPYSEPSFAVQFFCLNYERKPKHWIPFPTFFISFYFWHRRFRLTTIPCSQSPNSAWSQDLSFNQLLLSFLSIFIWNVHYILSGLYPRKQCNTSRKSMHLDILKT